MHRFFTPKEANEVLPVVRALLERAAERHKRMAALVDGASTGLGRAAAAIPELERLKGEVEEIVTSIQKIGVEVKALDTGLLDFPALRDGRPVLLCWQLGEESVAWWHPVHTGYAGRQRLEATELSRWEWRN